MKFFTEIYLHFLWFLNSEMPQVVEILPILSIAADDLVTQETSSPFY